MGLVSCALTNFGFWIQTWLLSSVFFTHARTHTRFHWNVEVLILPWYYSSKASKSVVSLWVSIQFYEINACSWLVLLTVVPFLQFNIFVVKSMQNLSVFPRLIFTLCDYFLYESSNPSSSRVLFFNGCGFLNLLFNN